MEVPVSIWRVFYDIFYIYVNIILSLSKQKSILIKIITKIFLFNFQFIDEY